MEISFEKSPKYFSWFTVNLKKSKNVSWSSAKNLLEQRFDLACQASVQSLAMNLVNFSLDDNESFILCLERFRMLVIESKVNYGDNVLLVYLFIKCLPKQVQDKVNSILRNVHRIENSSLVSDLKVHYAPADWAIFEKIISGHVAAIEEVLSVFNKQKISSKKRKILTENEPSTSSSSSTSVPFASGPLSSAASKHASFDQLRKQGICTYCRVAKYDMDHGNNCEVKLQYLKRRNQNRRSVSNNTKDVHDNVTVKNKQVNHSINFTSTSDNSNPSSSHTPESSTDIPATSTITSTTTTTIFPLFDEKLCDFDSDL